MRHARFHLAALVLALPLCSAAHAEGYEITPVGERGAYIGCVAIDANTGVGFAAVGQSLSVLMNAALLRVNKGDQVDGTWAVDGGKERPLSAEADNKDAVSADLQASKEILALLANGNQISATIGATYVDFDLGGSKQALQDLAACMDKNVKS